MPKITEMYAFVVADKDENDEGIMGMRLFGSGEWMPFVGADMKRVESLKEAADKIVAQTHKPYKILRFKLVE